MIRISSEDDLLSAFRPIDRDHVQVPAGFKFPLPVKDYLAWVEPSGHRVYLLFPDPDSAQPMGVVFQRTPTPAENASMCQWCHSVRTGSAVGLLTAAASRDHRIGAYLCADLNCKENARSAPSVHDFNEGLSGQERIQRVLWRMSDFAKRNLF